MRWLDKLLGAQPIVQKGEWFRIYWLKNTFSIWGKELKSGKVMIAYDYDSHLNQPFHYAIVHGIWWKDRRWHVPDNQIIYGGLKPDDYLYFICFTDEFATLAMM